MSLLNAKHNVLQRNAMAEQVELEEVSKALEEYQKEMYATMSEDY